MTASLRATATRARAMPRPLAIFIAPGTQAGPFAAAHQQRVGGFVEGGAGEFVTTSADLAGDVGLAGLIAGRRQPEMGTHVPRAPEAVRLVDRRPKRQRGDRANARDGHQTTAD